MPGVEAYGNENMVYLFFGVLPLIGLFLWSYHWKKAKSAAFAHIASMRKISDAVSRPKVIVKRCLLCLAYLLLVLALMRPQGKPDQELKNDAVDTADKKMTSSLSIQDLKPGEKGKEGQKVKIRESARDIIFLLDVSASMGAGDLYPDRLSKAKDMINDIVSALEGEHIGLVIFTSVPSVKCVLTLDYTYFKQVLDGVRINDNDLAGTKLYPALEEIIHKQFDFSGNKFKELIIITDGGDTDLEGLSGDDKSSFEKTLFQLVKEGQEEKGIRVHALGLGTKAGSVIQGVQDAEGKPVKSSLNEELLSQISKEGKGVYVAVADSNVDMKEIYQKNIGIGRAEDVEKEIEVDQDKLKELVQKEKEKEDRKVVYEELYLRPLLLALLLLLAEFFISERKKRFTV